MPRAVSVELGDGLEEVEEIRAVRGIQGRDEPGVDEDELRPVALLVDFLQLGAPGGGFMTVRAQLLEDFLSHVEGVFGGGGRLAVAAQCEGELFGFVEAHHDVSWVQVRVDEVVDEEHMQEGIETFVGDFLLEHAAAVFEKSGERDSLREFLDQDLTRGVGGVGVGEPGGGAVYEFLAEHGQVGGFDAQVELQAHHLTELEHFVREGEPFHGRDRVDGGGEEGHDLEVAAHDPLDFGVQDFDGDVAGGDSGGGALDEDVDVLAHPPAEVGWVGVNVVVTESGEVRLEFCLVDLGYGADAERLFLEFVEDLLEGSAVECFDDGSLGGGEGVSGSIGMKRGHSSAHFLREDVCS